MKFFSSSSYHLLTTINSKSFPQIKKSIFSLFFKIEIFDETWFLTILTPLNYLIVVSFEKKTIQKLISFSS